MAEVFKTNMAEDFKTTRRWSKLTKQVGATLLYMVTSIIIVMVNKAALTTYRFPSFQVLGIGQILAIIVVTRLAKAVGMVSFPDISIAHVYRILPLPIFYVGNLMFGLGSTQELNIPMFTVLRRFTIPFVAVGQIVLFNKYERREVYFTIFLMVCGAFVAAEDDLTFDVQAYIMVLLNNLANAANSLYIQRSSRDMSNYEILFYNAIVVLIPAIVIAYIMGDIELVYAYESWNDQFYIACFLLSCLLGFVLMYSQVLCAKETSALTLTVVGCIKNILVTYIGMFIGGDYIFSWTNFIGINISVAASVGYSVLKFSEQEPTDKDAKSLPTGSNNSFRSTTKESV